MSAKNTPVGVVGGGAFGQALAIAVARAGNDVRLWSRSRHTLEVSEESTVEGLPPGTIEVTPESSSLGECELIYFAVPSTYVGEHARRLGDHFDGRHLLVHVSRGLVNDTPETLSQLLRRETACRRVGVLAGPLIAKSLRQGSPGGGIVGSRFPDVARAVRDSLECGAMRIYETSDVIGVEIASAMVGLLALIVGYARTLGFGPGTLAVLASRGLSEAARIGSTLELNPQTFFGLAGAGDMMAVMAGDDRPELRLGRALAEGVSLAEAGRETGVHIEGIAIANQVATYATRVGMEAPITDTLRHVLSGEFSAEQAIERLMSIEVRTE